VPPEEPARPSHPLRPFRSSSFRGLWTGTTASSLGASVASVAFSWFVYSTTHAALDVTILGITNFAPGLVVGLLAGALADRYERRRLMISADAIRAAAVALLAVYLVLRGFDLVVVLGIAAVVSAMGALFRPASNALLPQILPGEQLPDANGLLFSGMTVGSFVGSAIGGLLIVVIGAASDFSLNALTYVVSAAMIAFVVLPPARRAPAAPSAAHGSLLGEVREGLAYVRGEAALLWTILASLGANFFLSIYGTYEVVYVLSFLRANAEIYGLLAATSGVGFGVGSLSAGRLGTVRYAGLVYTGTWAIGGLLIVELAFVRSVPNAAAVFAAVGFLGGLGNSTYLACVQRIVPEGLLGRFFSIDEVGSFAVIPLGQIAGGVLLVLVGIPVTYVVAGAGAFGCTILLLLSRSARRLGYPPRPP
jgi:predicted MFS family arabinose efflux permease